jgi:hypothetical protein
MLAIGGGQDRKQGVLTTAKRFSSTQNYGALSATYHGSTAPYHGSTALYHRDCNISRLDCNVARLDCNISRPRARTPLL